MSTLKELPKVAFDLFPGNIINNALVPTEKTHHGIDPSTERHLWDVPVATKSDLDTAVRHARAASTAWSKTTVEERSRLLLAYVEELGKYAAEFENLVSLECGKPAQLAKMEVGGGIGLFLAGFAKIDGVKDEIIEETDDHIVYNTYTPLGVCAAIVPWNWPFGLAVGKIGPALMTGNCLIIKPSPFTPYSALKMGEIAARIFPPGVLQVLNGNDDLGPWITEHENVDMVNFTGSSRTGKFVAASCAKTLKRFVLELGGNDAAVVCEDVDLQQHLPKIASWSFANSGQICMAIKRIYVHEKIYDEFRDAMVKFTKENLKVGLASEQGVFMGPLQNKVQYDMIKGMHADIDKHGWISALPGRAREDQSGYLIEPVIVDNPPENSSVVAEEAFGPVVPLIKWSDEDDVIARANGLKAGLGASVWSQDLDRAERIARQLKAGSVWMNSHFEVSPRVPMGGIKESGYGREYGLQGFKEHMNQHVLWIPKRK